MSGRWTLRTGTTPSVRSTGRPGVGSTAGRLAVGALVAAAVAVVAVPTGAVPPSGATRSADDPLVAPVVTHSADGRTATDGRRTLSASSVHELADGQLVTVAGQGYDESKGIYVALCVVPPANVAPSPCAGGADRDGQAGASQWISSNPPSYGVGVATPYGPGGTFSTSFAVSPQLAPGIDCRSVRCALVTRNDHLRSADRSQDLLLPVTFGAAPPPTTVPPAPAPGAPGTSASPTQPAPATSSPPPTVTLPPTTTTTAIPPPTTAVAADGRSVTDGSRRLEVSTAAPAEGGMVEVRGQGFDPAVGLYVAVCAMTPEDGAIGACASGSPAVTRWVASDEDAGTLGSPMSDDGSFAVDLAVPGVLDDGTDCRELACAVVARPDASAPSGVAPLAVPIRVGPSGVGTGTSAVADDVAGATSMASTSVGSGGGSGGGAGPAAAAAAVGVAAAIVVWRRRATTVVS